MDSTERLQTVEALGVQVQHRVLVVVGEMLVVDDLFDLVLAVLVVNLVRKVENMNGLLPTASIK